MNPRRTSIVLLLLLVLVAAACGQKAGVAGVSAAGGAEDGSAAFDELGGTADVDTPAAGAAPAPGTDPAASDAAGTPAPGDAAAPDGAAPAPAAGSVGGQPAAAGDRTGITDDRIKIGLHAPVTGAAPVPTESFRRGVPIYWNFVAKKGGVFGREVEVVFRDDEFNPSTAVRVCRELVEQEKVFLLIGAAGADQITACAKYANSVGVPYLSAGVNESGLAGLRGYFALSQTYLQQSPMLAQFAKKTTKNNKFAILIEDTPSFRETKGSIEAEAERQGLEVVFNEYLSKGASQAEILTTSSQLRQSGADVVYFLGPPTAFIALAQQGQSQGYVPSYIGPGLSNGLNIVANAGCPGVGASSFLSPFPQTDAIDRLDPDFNREYRAQTGQSGDDFGIALWGLNKTVHQFFNAAGEGMSRQSFVQTLESGKQYASNVFPPVQYDQKNHFGAGSSHHLRADCGSRTFRTAGTFVKGF